MGKLKPPVLHFYGSRFLLLPTLNRQRVRIILVFSHVFGTALSLPLPGDPKGAEGQVISLSPVQHSNGAYDEFIRAVCWSVLNTSYFKPSHFSSETVNMNVSWNPTPVPLYNWEDLIICET